MSSELAMTIVASDPFGKPDVFGVDATIARRIQCLSGFGAASLVALGLTVLAGWLLDIEMLRRFHPQHAPLAPTSALLFVLLGVAIVRGAGDHPDNASLWSAGCVVIVGAIGALRPITGVSLGFDEYLARGVPLAAEPMRQVMAACFVLLGIATLALQVHRLVYLAQGIACALLVATFLATCVIIYEAESMFGVDPQANMAVHAIGGALVASVAILMARTDRGVMAILASRTGAGGLLRWLTPALVVFPVVFGHLGLEAETRGFYGVRLGDALLVTATTVILFVVTAFIARSLHRSEVVRRRVQDQLLERERQLAESEYKYRDFYEYAPDMCGSVRTADGIVVDCNQTLLDTLGLARDDVIGRSVFELYDPSCRPDVAGTLERFRRTGVVSDVELTMRRADGAPLQVLLSATAIRDEHGHIVRSRAIWRDVEGRRRSEELRERERFFQLSADMVGIADTEGRLLQVNPAFGSVLGYPQEELVGAPYLSLVHPDDRAATREQAANLARGHTTLRFTNRYHCRDGSYRWLQWRAQPDGQGLVYATARDITDDIRASEELRRSEESLRASLREREVLLQEVHHRVKNNLQVISSLIRLQMREPGNFAAATALRECQNRIQSIALIHEKLYQTDDYARVPFSEYAAGLLADIFEAAAASERNIALDIAADPISLSVDKAIPCGLILNELVSNALKHAFRGVDRGTVRVELRNTADGCIVLSVTDDGVGVPTDFDPWTSSTLGVQLISTLVEQLRGQLVIERAAGTTFRVRFPAEGLG